MKLDAQMARVNAASNNVSNAISFNQTQDGYLSKVSDALSRMSELSVLAQDVTKSSGDIALYQQEFQSLGNYVNDVATKSFNGVSLFDGSSLNVTTDSDANTFANAGVNLSSTSYTDATSADISTDAAGALTKVKSAIDQLASDRAQIGTNEESLGYYSNQLSTLSNNLSAAKSQITDVDVATESTQYSKYNILVQSGTAMLAQANSLPQSVLRLIS